MVGDELVEHVGAVQPHRAHPGEVVQADLVDRDPPGRLDAEQPREHPLEADRDVAQADRAVARVEQRAGDDPDGVREVDDPRAGRSQLAGALGDVEHDRDGAQRLGEPAGAGRLLADAPAAQRERLVAEPRGLPADAKLEEDGVGAVERAVQVGRLDQPAAEALAREHAPREAGDDLEPRRVDVVEDQLGQVEAVPLAGEAGDELGRVRRPAADDRDLHPLTPVSVTPSTNAFWAAKKMAMTGAMNRSVAAIVRFHCTW